MRYKGVTICRDSGSNFVKTITSLVCLFIIHIFSQSAIAEVTWLTPTENVHYAVDLTVSPEGLAYVAEGAAGKIEIFNHGGLRVGSFSADYPSAVAVDRAGRLYVAKGKYSTASPPYNIPGEVKVYEINGRLLTYVMSLGSGKGEFVNPTDICIDRSGIIYVVDSDAHSVKVYTPDGRLVRVIGKYGIGDGYFNLPLSVDVDEASGEIYVTDKQLVPDSTSGYVSGARVQVYNQQGVFQRGFGRYLPGDLISPSDIALHDGKAYIADSYQNVVIVYDAPSGAKVTVLQSPDNMMRMPVSLAISGDGLMYIASARTERLYRAGLENFADISVSPGLLEFEAIAGGAVPAAQDIRINNTGAGTLAWTARTDNKWLTMRASSGQVGPSSADTVQITVDHRNLSAGSYEGNVSFSSAGGVTETVAVRLTVQAQPVMIVTPLDMTFEVRNGIMPPSQGLQVTVLNSPVAANWTVSTDAAWLKTIPAESGASVYISGSEHAPGEYHGKVRVDFPWAAGSPAEVAVTLRVIETGAISVTANISEASYTVSCDNGKTYFGSGRTWSVSGVAAGTCSIEYHDARGYRTPPGQTRTLDRGGSIEFTGEYRHVIERIVTAGGRNANGAVRINDAFGNIMSAFRLDVDAGFVQDIAVGDLDNDKKDEIIVSLGKSNGEIGIFSAEGLELGRLSDLKEGDGAFIAAGDVDGDGAAEILTNNKEGSAIRVYYLENGSVIYSGVEIITDKAELLYSADMDGDGREEVITAASGEQTALQIWKISAAESGGWTASLYNEMIVDMKAIAIGSAGRADDGTRKILIMDRNGNIMFIAHDGSISEVRLSVRNACDMSTGDVDGDGDDEIITVSRDGSLKIFGMDGTPKTKFRLYNGNSPCVRAAVGDFGY